MVSCDYFLSLGSLTRSSSLPYIEGTHSPRRTRVLVYLLSRSLSCVALSLSLWPRVALSLVLFRAAWGARLSLSPLRFSLSQLAALSLSLSSPSLSRLAVLSLSARRSFFLSFSLSARRSLTLSLSARLPLGGSLSSCPLLLHVLHYCYVQTRAALICVIS